VFHEDLDALLYAWLSEPDELRAEQHFTRYFQTAFPGMCRFVRSLGADAATAEDVSQQALIKLFAHLGFERRRADVRLREALSALAPLAFGALHVQLVQTWRAQVGGFREAAVRFRMPRAVQQPCAPAAELRDEINSRVEPLRRQGMNFLREVRERVGSSLNALIDSESSVLGIAHVATRPRQSQSRDAAGEGTADAVDVEVGGFVAALLRHADSRDGSQVDTELGCPGVVGFVNCTRTVCESLPLLAIPSNGLLYTIARRQFVDSLRTKRPQGTELTASVGDEATRSVLDDLDLEDGWRRDVRGRAEVRMDLAVSDRTAREDCNDSLEHRYGAFLEFLRAPLTRAEGALAEATRTNKAKAEQARVDSLRRKYDRVLAVLAALHESPQPSEEEIAQRQGLTRNQVKYVIERIREEFNYFFPELAREAQGRRKRQGGDS
jgi:hypothetical protein